MIRPAIEHWNDPDWLDPYWELELVEPHPQLEGMRNFYTRGPSYSLKGEIEPTRLEPVT